MSGFKLLGIRTGRELTEGEILLTKSNNPFLGTTYNYLKSLNPNQSFFLFNEYSLNDEGSVLTYSVKNESPNIYKLKNNLDTNIEVSAIVGKNGSGKSTLIEILYLAIHNLAVKADVLYDDDRTLVELPQSYLHCELYFLVNENLSYKLKMCFDGSNQNEKCIIYKAEKKNNKFEFKKPSEETLKEDLKNLFYAISVNYSIYGLNSEDIGNWINHLFHKNDAYQTPLVINPMRTKGDFNINREKELTIYRLLSNTVLKYGKDEGDVEVVGGIKLTQLTFKLNTEKTESLEFEETYITSKGENINNHKRTIQELFNESGFKNLNEIVNQIIKGFLGRELKLQKHVVDVDKVKLYIVKKLYKIAFTYKKYWKYLEDKNNKEKKGIYKPIKFQSVFIKSDFAKYLEVLKQDTSHITLKLRQALNYLENNPFKGMDTSHPIPSGFYSAPFNKFAKKLLDFKDKIINNLPPSLFEVTIHVSKEGSKENFDLSNLSSGELQLINSVQSTLYHLNNLESYAKSKDSDDINYKNALIIFDEIELYFHPEYQRKIVNHFIKEIDQLELKLIKGIHIIYITHSPFVLSDIPHTNQLILSDGKPIKSENTTFGANIHELLIDNFFMSSTIGEFSKEKINEFIKKLNETIKNRNNKKPRLLKNSIKELETLGGQSFIELIGDSLIKDKLLQMYFLATEKSDKEGLKKYYQKKLENLN